MYGVQSHAIIQYHIVFLWDYYQSNQINCLCTYGLHNDNNSKGEKNNHNTKLNHVMLPNVYKYVHWFNLSWEYCEQDSKMPVSIELCSCRLKNNINNKKWIHIYQTTGTRGYDPPFFREKKIPRFFLSFWYFCD